MLYVACQIYISFKFVLINQTLHNEKLSFKIYLFKGKTSNLLSQHLAERLQYSLCGYSLSSIPNKNFHKPMYKGAVEKSS